MVRVIAIVVVLASVADANPVRIAEQVEDPPEHSLLGFRIGLGKLPVDGSPHIAMSLGLGVEHRVFGRWRVFGEYEWLWLERSVPKAIEMAPEPHGDGQRLQLGVRHVLVDKRLSDIRLFIDGEAGGGLALVSDSAAGVRVMPDGFAGLRFGYDLYTPRDTSSSNTFEAEFLLRAIAFAGGAGAMFGIGMGWN